MNLPASFPTRYLSVRLISFLLYLALLAFSIWNHELWGDEIHSWNIAKASGSLSELFQNIRYEGHPPLWYILIWCLSKLTQQAFAIQILQYLLAATAMWLLLFRSPFPTSAKVLLPFGYYLLYEYGTFSRNYALALLLAFGILSLLRSGEAKPTAYYLLLFLLANTHLIGIILAISIHSYLYFGRLSRAGIRTKTVHLAFGAVCILTALVFIFPPGDSELNTTFWLRIWNKEHLTFIATAGLRSFFPMPTWWEYNFWNTHFMWHWAYDSGLKKLIVYTTSFSILLLACGILKMDRNSLRLFLFNVLITAIFGLLFPLSSARYVGFLFIGFLAALWLHPEISTFSLKKKPAFFVLLLLQIPGAVFAIVKDRNFVFSRASEVSKLIQKVPEQDSLLTDYYALNPLLAFTKRSWYCIEAKKEVQCILWTQELTKLAATKDPYRSGAEFYLRQHSRNQFYLISGQPPKNLSERDSAFFLEFAVIPIDSIVGSLEKYSNLYLYKVERTN